MFVIRGIIGLVLTLSLAGFAAMNTDPIEVFISPLHDPVDFPLYLVALVSVAVGFIAGGLMVWINTGGVRKDRRKKKKEIKILEKEVDALKDDKFSAQPPASDMFPALPSQ